MANTEIKTKKSYWQPVAGNLNQHKSDSDIFLYHEINSIELEKRSTVKPTHGKTDEWDNYGELDDFPISGKDIHNKSQGNGIKFGPNKTGTKHMINYYIKSNCRWIGTGNELGIVGAGFELYRKRTDSVKDNNNAEQHVWFIQKWGIVFKHRTSDEERIWSSDYVKKDGGFNSDDAAADGNVAEWHFYSAYFPDNVMGKDWLIGGLIIQVANKNQSTKPGDATSYLQVYNLRYYYNLAGPGKNARYVLPKTRSYEQRNNVSF